MRRRPRRRHARIGLPTVLLVESAQDDREMYATYLRALRFRALEIDDTAAALAAAAAADVVVTGIHVPGPFDGVELVRRLRANQHTSHKRVIVLTASVTPTDRDRALAAGADVFVPKPCLPARLVRIIRRPARDRMI